MKDDTTVWRWVLRTPLEGVVGQLLAPVNRVLAPLDRLLASLEARLAPTWRPLLGVWLAIIAGMLALRFVALRADFPMTRAGRRFIRDGFLYSDEGWYAANALRWFRTGEWYLPGDVNFGVVLPVQQLLHALSFGIFGPGIEAARLTTVFSFLILCALTYLLIRRFEAPWVGWIAVWVMATNFFFFTHSRLAVSENPMMMFVMGSALIATYAQGARVAWLAPLAGLVFLLGVLTKTPAIVLAPVVAMGLLFRNWPGGWRVTPRMIAGPGLFSIVVLGGFFGWNTMARALFPADVAFFESINVEMRTEWNIARICDHAGWFLDNLHNIDRVLFQFLLFGVPALVLLNKRYRSSPLVLASIAALIIYFLTFSIYANRQYRYFAAMAPPAAILVAMGVRVLWEARTKSPLVRLALVGMLGLVLAMGGRGITPTIKALSERTYTFSDEASRMHVLVAEKGLPNNVLLGHISCTFALYEDFFAVNDLYKSGPLVERLARWQPHLLVSEYPVVPEPWRPLLEAHDRDPRSSLSRLEDLRAFGEIEHLGPLDVLDNTAGRNLQLYRIHPHSVSPPAEDRP